MELLRQFLFWIARTLFGLSVIACLNTAILVQVLGSPEPIKQVLENSDAYSRIIETVASQSTAARPEIPLGNDQIQEVLDDALPPKQVKEDGETIVDSIYKWLEGKSEAPDFNIDFSKIKVAIANAVADRAAERIQGLPTCTSVPATTDPFEIDCRPPGINIENEKKKIVDQMLASEQFLPGSAVTADSLPKDENGQTLTQSYSELPRIYQLLKVAPWFFGVLSLIIGAGIVYFSRDRRQALRNIAWTTMGIASFILVTTLIFGVIIPSFTRDLAVQVAGGGDSAKLLTDILGGLIGLIVKATLISSAVLFGVGVTAVMIERFTNKQPATNALEPATNEVAEKPTINTGEETPTDQNETKK